MKEKEEQRYTTTKAAELLGISFITLKRWIYSGKIKAEKDTNGRWSIAQTEIDRIVSKKERLSDLDTKILGLVESRTVAYLREIQVAFEDEYIHEDTYTALKRLSNSYLNTYFDGNRWFFPKDKEWSEVEDTARQKAELMRTFIEHPRRYEIENAVYMDYSEYIVEAALMKTGYVIVARDTYYFNGRTYRRTKQTSDEHTESSKNSEKSEKRDEDATVSASAGRPTDLDFIAYIPEKGAYLGIQVKNRMEHPTFEEVGNLLDICNYLSLRPILIGRIIHPFSYQLLPNNKGRALRIKRLLLQPPFPRDKFKLIVDLSIPIAVYQWPPAFLLKLLIDLKAAM